METLIYICDTNVKAFDGSGIFVRDDYTYCSPPFRPLSTDKTCRLECEVAASGAIRRPVVREVVGRVFIVAKRRAKDVRNITVAISNGLRDITRQISNNLRDIKRATYVRVYTGDTGAARRGESGDGGGLHVAPPGVRR